MERYVCIHGHFYQPPRENPWLEAVEVQDSAYPYHDWNERVTAESYATNGAARILDGEGRIVEIVNNYERISFNFGPTLLSWLEEARPDVYAAVLEADRRSLDRFSGHGSALAQAYGHLILPLATKRDRVTQVIWGLRDFARRFGRPAEGMWLPETAVDVATLEALAGQGVGFTILAPHQARRVRPLDGGDWRELGHGEVDPSMPYLCRLASGREIALFFYDGPIARAVAFEGLLRSGGDFAARLLSGFSEAREGAQLVHVATDGETYGHHHRHGEMALAYALHRIETDGAARLTNYGEFLALRPPTWEVEIEPNTSWSCVHGIERWRSDCGCRTGGEAGWNQRWRAPLRRALDWLRDELAPLYEAAAQELLIDPWAARDDYVEVVLDRSPESVDAFLAAHRRRELGAEDRVRALQLLELQRHAMTMFTSCGWFFNDLSGIETVQVLHYAGRALQLAEDLFADPLEQGFVTRLAEASGNRPGEGDGRRVFERYVRPAAVRLTEVGAHYAVSSLFEDYPERARIFCFRTERSDVHGYRAGRARLVVGRVRVTSEVTGEEADLSFGALHFGDHNITAGVRTFRGQTAFAEMEEETARAFQHADFAAVIRLLDRYFGELTYSLKSLFRDEQRKVLGLILTSTLDEAESQFRTVYEHNAPLLRFLSDLGTPFPRPLRAAAEFILNVDLERAFAAADVDLEGARALLRDTVTWSLELDTPGLSYALRGALREVVRRLRAEPDRAELLGHLAAIVELAVGLPFGVDLWEVQNLIYELRQETYPRRRWEAEGGEAEAERWVEVFRSLGDALTVKIEPGM